MLDLSTQKFGTLCYCHTTFQLSGVHVVAKKRDAGEYRDSVAIPGFCPLYLSSADDNFRCCQHKLQDGRLSIMNIEFQGTSAAVST